MRFQLFEASGFCLYKMYKQPQGKKGSFKRAL